MRMTRRRLLIGGLLLAGSARAGWMARGHVVAARARPLHAERVANLEPVSGALDFFVIGDSGADTDVRRRVVASMSQTAARVAPRFVILTGDNVYPHGVTSVDDPACKRNFDDAFDAPGLDVPFYPALGNHDHEGDPGAQVEYSRRDPNWRLPAPYHAFRQVSESGVSAEFFILDTTPLRLKGISLSTPEQVTWLEDALSRSTATWKVAVGHHPIVSGGPIGGSSSVHWHLTPGFARHQVDFYLSGHEHDLQLVDSGLGWLQVVSGAASSPRPAGTTGLFSHGGGGFVWISLRADAAWIQFISAADGPLAAFRIDRPSVGNP